MADKHLVWLDAEIRTPPFSQSARIEAGVLLRHLQRGIPLSLPHSRPMPVVGSRCHELRVRDAARSWRIIYRTDHDAIVIAGIFAKTTPATPRRVIDNCKRRLRLYDVATRGE